MITLILFLVMTAFLLVFAVLYLEFRDIPNESRDFMDPLPLSLRIIWPLVRWGELNLARFCPEGYRNLLSRRLQLSGLHYLFNVDQLLGLKIVAGFLGGGAMLSAGLMLDKVDMVYVLLVMTLFFFLPDLRLNEIRQVHKKKVIRELPVMLDFLVLGIESGQNLTGAIRLALSKGPEGALRQEFGRVLRDISAGVSRADAFLLMQERVDVQEVTSMVAAMIQAEKVGSSLGPILREQAAQRRAERFLLAEKKAFEAPVKMLAPLVIFIFPCTFAFLGYFLYQKIMMSGAF